MLQDLDELILKCRNERARAYILEAVICCKASAYRSAIVSTWIAVAFDIVDKIHELSLTGDKEAQAFVTSYENAIANNNVEQLLKIERVLLETARDKFELISIQEHADLVRLQEDRHRCAHPSRMSNVEAFSPPAELARLHIRSAVEHLMQHEPSQGKAALAFVWKEIESKYFPTAGDKAKKILDGTPLRRARPALVRNLIVVLLKAVLSQTADRNGRLRYRAAILSVRVMHPSVWGEVVRTETTRLFRNLPDDDSLAKGVELLRYAPDIANSLESDQITKIEQFLMLLPDEGSPQ
jgi:hypothetical protein